MKETMINEEMIPYKTLERYGLTAEMSEDLPNWAREDIAEGYNQHHARGAV